MITDLHSVTVLLQPFTVPISIPANALVGVRAEKGRTQKELNAEAWEKEQRLRELSTHVDGHGWSGNNSVLHLI